MSFFDAIASRAVGQFPISIATSLAIESALGIHPDILVAKAPALGYAELWINMRTLFRNFMGALDKTMVNAVSAPILAEALLAEMETITDILKGELQGKPQIIFYISNYKDIERHYKFATIRRDTTPKQKEYTAILNQTMARLLQLNPGSGCDMRVFDLKLIPQHHPQALIITHYAYDLVAYPAFAKLTLLESHTGAIKERSQWYSKYINGKELTMIPFREDFIQVFGDNETFRPSDAKLRKEVVEMATKYRWTAITTRDKILYGINQMPNPYFREVLKSILVT